MTGGKPAGVRCVQLTDDQRCRIFGRAERPSVCSALRPSAEMCGRSDAEAMAYLEHLEQNTRPEPARGDGSTFIEGGEDEPPAE